MKKIHKNALIFVLIIGMLQNVACNDTSIENLSNDGTKQFDHQKIEPDSSIESDSEGNRDIQEQEELLSESKNSSGLNEVHPEDFSPELISISHKTNAQIEEVSLNHIKEYPVDSENFRGVPKAILRIMINQIFAQGGYAFSSPEWYRIFGKRTWYAGEIGPKEWDESYVGEDRKKVIKEILKYEKMKEYCNVLNLVKKEKATEATDGNFVITLPNQWKDNYFILKKTDGAGIKYSFYEYQNYANGFNGLLGNICVYDSSYEDSETDMLIYLGSKGDKKYYFSYPNTIQWDPQGDPELENAYETLATTLESVIESFQLN